MQQRAEVLLAIVVGRRKAVAGWAATGRSRRDGGSHLPAWRAVGARVGGLPAVRRPSRTSSSAACDICASRSSIEAAMSMSPSAIPSDRDRARFRVPWQRRCRCSWSSSVSSPCRRYPVLKVRKRRIRTSARTRGLIWTRRIVVAHPVKETCNRADMRKTLNIRLTKRRFLADLRRDIAGRSD